MGHKVVTVWTQQTTTTHTFYRNRKEYNSCNCIVIDLGKKISISLGSIIKKKKLSIGAYEG